MSDKDVSNSRRPLATRAAGWARALAAALARRRVPPNLISVSSVFFALVGSAAMFSVLRIESPGVASAAFVLAAFGIQFRLLANMLDGMVAVEGGLGGPLGDVYNEFPDRLADVALILPAGYLAAAASWPCGVELGWLACCLALLTAYVRAMGASINGQHAFQGPMAKPHRMFVLTCACLAAAVGAHTETNAQIMYVVLVLMNAGMLVTIIRRLRAISASLVKKDQ